MVKSGCQPVGKVGGWWHWQGAPEEPAPSNICSHADETSLSTPKRMRKVGWRGDHQPQVLVKPDIRRGHVPARGPLASSRL